MFLEKNPSYPLYMYCRAEIVLVWTSRFRLLSVKSIERVAQSGEYDVDRMHDDMGTADLFSPGLV